MSVSDRVRSSVSLDNATNLLCRLCFRRGQLPIKRESLYPQMPRDLFDRDRFVEQDGACCLDVVLGQRGWPTAFAPSDDRPLELGQCAEDVEQQSTAWRGGVDSLGEGFKPHFFGL